jgi:hypothetical protein
VDVTKNMTETLGNVKLQVTSKADFTIFEWVYILDGVDFPGMTLEFQKGIFCGLSDIWRIYKVGSTVVNVSREEAINIALNYVENFSWNVSRGDDNPSLEVTDFNVIDEPLTANLLTTRSREPLTMYPYWRIELYLDKVYPGFVNWISLAIWADTGEVISCVPLSGGGGPLPDLTTSHQTQQTDQAAPPINMALIIVAMASATIIAIAIATAAIKKKHK